MIPKAGEIWYIKNPKVSEYEVDGKTIQRNNAGYSLITKLVSNCVYYKYTSDNGCIVKKSLNCPLNTFLECYIPGSIGSLRNRINKIKSSI